MTESERQDIARARERADLARLRFANSFDDLLGQLTPARLGAEALDAATDRFEKVKNDLLHRLRHWPLALIGALLALLALIFWRPSTALLRSAARALQFIWPMISLWRAIDE